MYPCSKVRFCKRVRGNDSGLRSSSHTAPPRRAMVVATFREENAWVGSAQRRQYEGKYGAEREAREGETVKHRADAP